MPPEFPGAEEYLGYRVGIMDMRVWREVVITIDRDDQTFVTTAYLAFGPEDVKVFRAKDRALSVPCIPELG